MVKYRIASALMIFHGLFMELFGVVAALPLIISAEGELTELPVSFIVPFFQDNLVLLLEMGAIYGIIRIIGAVGLWMGRKWGLALSVINCVVTLILMPFMLPAGIADGLLSGSALILILVGMFEKENVSGV